MQRIALSWFVLQLTHGDSFAVGIMARRAVPPLHALRALRRRHHRPARRAPPRDLARRSAQLVTAVALAWIALGGFAQPWMLYTIAFLNGARSSCSTCRRASSSPTGWSAARRCRTRSRSTRASSTRRASSARRSPASIIGFAGVGVCFLVNAISFLAVLLGLLAMRVERVLPARGVRAAGDPARHARRARVRAPAAADADRARADARAQHVLLQLQRDAAGARVHDAARARVRVRHPLGGVRRRRARRRARRRVASDARRRR